MILYETKKGYTKKCAEILHSKIKNSDIFSITEKGYRLKDYDKILIGVPLYVGEIEKITKEFISRNKPILLNKKLGIFVSGMAEKEFHIAVQDSLPPNIFYHAEIVDCGGVLNYSMLTLREKYTIWRRLKIRKSLSNEKIEALDILVD